MRVDRQRGTIEFRFGVFGPPQLPLVDRDWRPPLLAAALDRGGLSVRRQDELVHDAGERYRLLLEILRRGRTLLDERGVLLRRRVQPVDALRGARAAGHGAVTRAAEHAVTTNPPGKPS